jgi:hypothetical protein
MGSRLTWNTASALLVVGLTLVLPRPVLASLVELTARPATGDTVDWLQFGPANPLFLTSPQSFTSTGGTAGTVSGTGLGTYVQCCIATPSGPRGTFDGDFAPGATVLLSGGPLTINFNTPVQSVGTQIQNNTIGSHFTAEILAFSGSQLLGAFIASGFSGDVADNSNTFLGVQDSTSDITSVTYLTFADGSSSSGPVAINQLTVGPGVAVTPLPAALPLYATGLGALALLRWRKKRKAVAA